MIIDFGHPTLSNLSTVVEERKGTWKPGSWCPRPPDSPTPSRLDTGKVSGRGDTGGVREGFGLGTGSLRVNGLRQLPSASQFPIPLSVFLGLSIPLLLPWSLFSVTLGPSTLPGVLVWDLLVDRGRRLPGIEDPRPPPHNTLTRVYTRPVTSSPCSYPGSSPSCRTSHSSTPPPFPRTEGLETGESGSSGVTSDPTLPGRDVGCRDLGPILGTSFVGVCGGTKIKGLYFLQSLYYSSLYRLKGLQFFTFPLCAERERGTRVHDCLEGPVGGVG